MHFHVFFTLSEKQELKTSSWGLLGRFRKLVHVPRQEWFLPVSTAACTAAWNLWLHQRVHVMKIASEKVITCLALELVMPWLRSETCWRSTWNTGHEARVRRLYIDTWWYMMIYDNVCVCVNLSIWFYMYRDKYKDISEREIIYLNVWPQLWFPLQTLQTSTSAIRDTFNGWRNSIVGIVTIAITARAPVAVVAIAKCLIRVRFCVRFRGGCGGCGGCGGACRGWKLFTDLLRHLWSVAGGFNRIHQCCPSMTPEAGNHKAGETTMHPRTSIKTLATTTTGRSCLKQTQGTYISDWWLRT